MFQRVFIVAAVLCAWSCAQVGSESSVSSDTSEALNNAKADSGINEDIQWANGFFLTQIYDARWNPSGMEVDTESNNCGPASLAMLITARDDAPRDLGPEAAIDHARALMYPGYPEIDATALPEGASTYEEDGRVFVDDDSHPVYLDFVDDEPSLSQGIENLGGVPVSGTSWDELNTLLEAHGGVIALGHITESWRARFSEDYGDITTGAIAHFIALFPASPPGQYIVCDPMHRGGPVVMNQSQLQSFFKSPVNIYETSLRVLAWSVTSDGEEK